MTAQTLDARDATKPPPAELDIHWVLKARRWMLYRGGWEKLWDLIDEDQKAKDWSPAELN